MNRHTPKYYRDLLRQGLFHAALLLSVFLFSGYNVHAETSLLRCDHTEVVQSRAESSVYSFSQYKTSLDKAVASDSFDIQPPYSWIVAHHNDLIYTKYKSYQKTIQRPLTTNSTYLKIPSPSSTDDTLPNRTC